jgi:phosphatidate cytidylyltransferase
MPSVSPKKTWEGAIGGLVFGLIVAWFMPDLFDILNHYQWMVVSLIVVVTGTIGDFTESWLKRLAGVKDSGKLIPGHGGILDRFDSVLFSIPFVYIYVEFII